MSRSDLTRLPPLRYPGVAGPVHRAPDLRAIADIPLSGTAMPGEVDYDELVIHRTWHVAEPMQPGFTRYVMFELSQRNPGQDAAGHFFKAVRFLRLTRVPRYLRQGNGASHIFEQQRDMLAALREQQVLFVNMVARSPEIPLLFTYGVQALGSSVEQAQMLADESYAVLTAQLDGTYQQLFYEPLTLSHTQTLARYQAQWDQLAVGRGRPLPSSTTLGGSSLLDGNRTDSESAANQLESFLRGMSQRSFLLSLITVPLHPTEMMAAWRNITQDLSKLRSDQSGTRSANVGMAIPMTLGASVGDTHGSTHQVGYGTSQTTTDGVSNSHAAGSGQSVSDGVSSSYGTSHSTGTTAGESTSVGDSRSVGVDSSHSTNSGVNESQTASQQVGTSTSDGLTTSASSTTTESLGRTVGTSESASSGASWSQGSSAGVSSGTSDNVGYSQGHSDSMSQSVGVSSGSSDGFSQSDTAGNGYDAKVGAFGVGSGTSEQSSQSTGTNTGTNSGYSQGVSGGSSNSTGMSSGHSASSGTSAGVSESYGGNTGRSSSVSDSQSASTSQAVGQSVAAAHTTGTSSSAGLSQAVGSSRGVGDSQGMNASQGTSSSSAASLSRTAGDGDSSTTGSSRTTSDQVSTTDTAGTSRSVAAGQNLSDAWAAASSRMLSQTSALGVAPSMGVAWSKNTFDEGKRMVADVIEAQAERYLEGSRSGAFLYQMYLVTPDRESLLAGAGLLKSAFWGDSGAPMPDPFHVVGSFDPDEKQRLLDHARAFTSYRRREPIMSRIEPFLYSSYVTPTEASAFCHPPVSEAVGLLAVHDSMPVLALPDDRSARDLHIGKLIDGERGLPCDWKFGIDVSELTHTLFCGITGSGKTTTLMRFLSELAGYRRPLPQEDGSVKEIPASILAIDWMRNMRDLASVVEPERFRFFSVSNPALGRFSWNPLAVPAAGMSAPEWLNSQADNFTAAMNLGEFGRSLIAELLTTLYTANRLEEFILRPAIVDGDTGDVLREAITLPAIDERTLPPGAVHMDADGRRVANVFTYPDLSRLVSIGHLAVLVAAKVEELSSPDAARLYGTAMRDRLQSLWRRLQYFAPGGQFDGLLTCDLSLTERRALTVSDLIDPDAGLVTVLETDGLDMPNRRLILGSLVLAVYRYGLHYGEGTFDHGGQGPGTFLVLEEAHELFGDRGEDEDGFSVATRTALYDSLFRRARALGLRLTAVVQNPGAIPAAITSQTSTAFVHKTQEFKDRDRVFGLLNWVNQVGQQQREYRYLGELPLGWCIVKLPSVTSFLEAAPVQVFTDKPLLAKVSDADLAELVRR